MRYGSRGCGILLFATLAVFVVGCSDGSNTTNSGSGTSSGSGGSGGNGGSSGSGGPTAQGFPGSELVSGGDVVKSSKYKMVISFGASTPAPGVAASPNHRLQGGLIGVTEGTK